MIVGHRRSAALLAMPLADTVRGVVLTALRGEPQFIPYYLAHGAGNTLSMARTLAALACGRRFRWGH